MARPLRIEYPGAWYHVMNRGNQRQVVFRQKGEYELFLSRLEATTDVFGVDVLAYCLMPNHFHLYVRTPQANLSRFMQGLLTSFTLSVNRRRGSNATVSGTVQNKNGRNGNAVSRYLHLNPCAPRPPGGSTTNGGDCSSRTHGRALRHVSVCDRVRMAGTDGDADVVRRRDAAGWPPIGSSWRKAVEGYRQSGRGGYAL